MKTAHISLISLEHHQSLLLWPHKHQNSPPQIHSLSPWFVMWDPKKDQEEEDSWEIRAFAEDTCNTTWPPRSYTCTFCRREFRSAQALGGHMNVHRRDRAQLHQLQPQLSSISSSFSPNSSSTQLIANQELLGSGDLCFLYQLPVPSHAFSCLTVNSGSSYPPYNLISASLPVGASSYPTFQCCSGKVGTQETKLSIGSDSDKIIDNSLMGAAMEDIDLELRLGHRPTQP